MSTKSSSVLATGQTCRACGKVFNSLTGFDHHRYGLFNQKGPDYNRKCMTDDELLSKGWSFSGYWRMPATEKRTEQLKKLMDSRKKKACKAI